MNNIDLDSINIETLEYFQVNFPNLYYFYTNVLDIIISESRSRGKDMKKSIETTMIILIIALFIIKSVQFVYLKKLTDRLIRSINIFLRVNQNEAFSEIMFTKEIMDLIKNPSESYINLNCTEKVINKKTIKMIEEDVKSNRKQKEKTQKAKSKKTNFSSHNIKPLSSIYLIVFIFLTFALIFLFIFFNYYFFTITYDLVVEVIEIGLFFQKLSAAPPTVIAFNRICAREKLIDNSLYKYPKTFERESKLFEILTGNIEKLEEVSIYIPKYSANNGAMENKILKAITFGSEKTNICNEIYLNNDIDLDEKALCLSVLGGAFSKNLLSVINSLVTSIKTEYIIDEPIEMNNHAAREKQNEEILNSLKSSVGIDRIMTQYFLIYTLKAFAKILKDFYKASMYQYINTLHEIVLSTTIFILIFVVFMINLIDSTLKKLYNYIVCILYLIPYEKILNDEQTNFLIKKLWRD